MRYFFLSVIVLQLSCGTQKTETKRSRVSPKLDILTDSINNGGTVKFKGYIVFTPELTSDQQANDIVNSYELKYDSIGQLNALGYSSRIKENLLIADIVNDTAYGEFLVTYSNIDSLPEYFEHSWSAMLTVNFKTESSRSIDTTFIDDELKVIVKK